MSNEREILELGERAQRLLNSDDFKAMIPSFEQSIVASILDSKRADDKMREDQYQMLDAFRSFVSHLNALASSKRNKVAMLDARYEK